MLSPRQQPVYFHPGGCRMGGFALHPGGWCATFPPAMLGEVYAVGTCLRGKIGSIVLMGIGEP